jgi:hypothetical protein
MIDGELMSESSNDRAGVSIQNTKNFSIVFFNRINARVSLQIGEGETLKQFELSGINRSLRNDEAVIYSSSFGPSTLTQATRYEISIADCRPGRMIGSFRDSVCKKVEAVSGSRNMKIPADGFVLSLGSDYTTGDKNDLSSEIEKILHSQALPGKFRIRRPIVLDGGQFSTDKKVDITNGVLLIRSGKIDITWEQEKAAKSFAETRHPRTAVAKLKDGKFLMITVDGRQPGVSVGMTLQELAEYLLSIGATDAMNLDGGGSTTMFVDGKVLNTPSDKEGERKVSDAIVVTLRKNVRR